jgi:uncharacterized LabA/DUF88 family protein
MERDHASDRRTRPLYAVLIDADNIPAKYAEAILKEVTSFGEPALRRVYADWSRAGLSAWADRILDLGLVAHQETANTRGKNASDIGLVIDAMDILHSGRFDGFVLVSSDSDFTRLASRIREAGLEVIGIGEAKTPKSLQNVCNRFVTLENIVEEEPAREGSARQPSKKQPATDAIPLILRAMDKIGADDEWYSLGQIGQYITADNPAFDVRTYGKTKLSELVAELKRFETRKTGGQLKVRRAD